MRKRKVRPKRWTARGDALVILFTRLYTPRTDRITRGGIMGEKYRILRSVQKKTTAAQAGPDTFFLKLKLAYTHRLFVCTVTISLPVNPRSCSNSTINWHRQHFCFFILAKFVKVPQPFMVTRIKGGSVCSTTAKNRLIFFEGLQYSLPN